MAVTRLSSYRFRGLSGDTKPTSSVNVGSLFTETDTGAQYSWDGSAWLAIPLDHANLQPPNIHVPCNFVFPDSTTRIAYSYVTGDIGKFIWQTDTDIIYMLTSTAPTFAQVSGSGTGEANTVSNIGTGGQGLFKQKVSVDFEFYNLNVDTSGVITITLDGGNNEVVFGFDLSAVDGDALLVEYAPTYYSKADDQLESHLAGIDAVLGTLIGALDSFDYVNTGNKKPVRLATVAPLPAYTPAGSGVGKTLTGNSNGQLSVDGIGVVYGNRILVKNETGAAQINNGIYVVTQAGDGSNPYILTRATDYDQNSDIIPGHIVQASEGNTNADEIFILATDAPINIESSYLVYNTIKAGITGSVAIASTANVTVDSVLLSMYHSAKWIIDIYDSVAGNREASEVIAREESLSVSWAQPAAFKVGDTINYTISFSSDGTSMHFKVQNNESNSITVRFRKLEV